jgi:hypothetical protein
MERKSNPLSGTDVSLNVEPIAHCSSSIKLSIFLASPYPKRQSQSEKEDMARWFKPLVNKLPAHSWS